MLQILAWNGAGVANYTTIIEQGSYKVKTAGSDQRLPEELDSTVSRGWEILNDYKTKGEASVNVHELTRLSEKLGEGMKMAEVKMEKAYREALDDIKTEMLKVLEE